MNQQKRILAINDISCFGKCSLTAALPILSAAGIETCVLPTAVLSAHTAFPDYTFRDLTEDMLPQADHWEKLGLAFDGIYSGYLGSIRQIACVEELIERFPCGFVLVDPVMGDNGRLYDGFDESFALEMKRLLAYADVIVPNVTEAAYLAEVPFQDGIHSFEYISEIVEKLKKLCKGDIVLTGIELENGKVGTAVVSENRLHMIEREKFDVFYSGTGDVFASALAAAAMSGMDLIASSELASDFVIDCIKETRRTSGDRNYGLNFELCIGTFLTRLGFLNQ